VITRQNIDSATFKLPEINPSKEMNSEITALFCLAKKIAWMKMRVGHKCVVDASVKLSIDIKPGACKDPNDRNDKKIQTGAGTAIVEPVYS